MVKYEFRVLRFTTSQMQKRGADFLVQELGVLGEDGWHLGSLCPEQGHPEQGHEDAYMAILQRPSN